MKILIATDHHVMPVLDLARCMAKETSTYREFDFEEEKARLFITDHVNNTGRLMLVAQTDQGELVGAFLATATETYFGRDIVTQDDAFYVLPEHRGKGTLAQFLMAYHQWAETLKPKYIYLGVTLGINDERTVEALKQAGYEPFGTLLRRTG